MEMQSGAAEPGTQRLNPQPCAAFSRRNPIERQVWCEHYDRCLDNAIERGWDSFNCTSCSAFRLVPISSSWLQREADHCRALICMLCEEGLGRRHFHWLERYYRAERTENYAEQYLV